MGERSSKLHQIQQLSGAKIQKTDDVRKLDLPENLKSSDLRNLEKLDAVIDHLKNQGG